MAKTYFDWAKFKARKGLNASVSPDEMDGILWQRKHGGPVREQPYYEYQGRKHKMSEFLFQSLKEDSDYVEYYYSLPLEEHSTRFASVIEGGTGSKKEKKKNGEGEEHDKEDDGIVYDDKVEDSPAHSDQMDEGTLKEEDGSARRYDGTQLVRTFCSIAFLSYNSSGCWTNQEFVMMVKKNPGGLQEKLPERSPRT